MVAAASRLVPMERAPSAPPGRWAPRPELAPRDPLGPVLRLDAHPQRRAGLALGLGGALLVHGAAVAAGVSELEALGAFAAAVRGAVTDRSETECDVDLSPPPPAPAPAPPPADAPPTSPPPAAVFAAPSPPPAAAVGEALTAAPAPEAPLDLTDAAFTLVTAAGARYSGGVSAPGGTVATAVLDGTARGGAATAPAPRTLADSAPRRTVRDLSRPAGVLGSTTWSTCPFPAEAEQAQVSSARVTLVVSVDARGRPRSATVQSETPSGFGFAARARQCALARRFQPARDADGKPVAGTTPPLNIRFTQ